MASWMTPPSAAWSSSCCSDRDSRSLFRPRYARWASCKARNNPATESGRAGCDAKTAGVRSATLRGCCRLPARRSCRPIWTDSLSKLCATLDVSRRLRMDGRQDRSFPFIQSISAACLSTCLLASIATPACAQTGPKMIDLDTMKLGAAPANFDFARTGQGGPGQWVVVDDATAPSKRAIEQSSTDRTDYRFPLAIYQPVTAKNVEV